MENGQNQPLQIEQLLAIIVEQLASVAWQKLGLQPDIATGQIHKDLNQAKTAVDCVAQISEHLIPYLDENDQRQIQNLVRDLKINYVQKTAEEN